MGRSFDAAICGFIAGVVLVGLFVVIFSQFSDDDETSQESSGCPHYYVTDVIRTPDYVEGQIAALIEVYGATFPEYRLAFDTATSHAFQVLADGLPKCMADDLEKMDDNDVIIFYN